MPSRQENKQENRATRKKVKPWKVKKAACLEDNSRAASDGQEKSCHFQSYQGRGKPCRHRVIILKVLWLGRILTAVFVMHVNIGQRAEEGSGFSWQAQSVRALGSSEEKAGRAAARAALFAPVPQQRSPRVEGLCYQPEG